MMVNFSWWALAVLFLVAGQLLFSGSREVVSAFHIFLLYEIYQASVKPHFKLPFPVALTFKVSMIKNEMPKDLQADTQLASEGSCSWCIHGTWLHLVSAQWCFFKNLPCLWFTWEVFCVNHCTMCLYLNESNFAARNRSVIMQNSITFKGKPSQRN